MARAQLKKENNFSLLRRLRKKKRNWRRRKFSAPTATGNVSSAYSVAHIVPGITSARTAKTKVTSMTILSLRYSPLPSELSRPSPKSNTATAAKDKLRIATQSAAPARTKNATFGSVIAAQTAIPIHTPKVTSLKPS
jgi:hypothetical protein